MNEWLVCLESFGRNRDAPGASGADHRGGGESTKYDGGTEDYFQVPTMGWMILAGSASFLGRNICDRSLATSVTYKLRS